MLDLVTGSSRDCTGMSRRQFLRIGGLSALGLSLPGFFRLQTLAAADAAGNRSPRTVNCIFMWMRGGPSHHDTFDPKPDAPAEIRGEFATIPTTLPGVRFVEHLPRLARQTDKFSIIRGHDPKNAGHGFADHLLMTGHPPNPSMVFPCYGSVISRERGYKDGMFPFVQLGPNVDHTFNGGVAGFLGDQYVAVTPVKNEGPVYASGDHAPAEEPFNLQEVARSAAGLNTWIVIFVLVVLQMTTALRPIVDTAETFLPDKKKFFLTHWTDSLSLASRRGTR